MQKTWVSGKLWALVALLLAGTSVKADVSANWGFTTGPSVVYDNVGGNQTSQINVTGTSGGSTQKAGFVIFTLSTQSTQSDSTPDSFSNVAFPLTIKITDLASGTQGSATVIGSYNIQQVSKNNFFGASIAFPNGASTVVQGLGNTQTGYRNYTITIKSATPSGAMGGSSGSIYAEVTIANGTGGGQGNNGGGGGGGGGGGNTNPSATPEPTSLLLAGLGLPLLGVYWRRRKSEAAAR